MTLIRLTKSLTRMTAAFIDRRVELFDPSDPLGKDIQRVSDLRSYSFVVLLGEPGIGKSTVLSSEAQLAGTTVTTVVAYLLGDTPPEGLPVFLDGLDEHRSEGSGNEKINQLAIALKEQKCPKWRLSCRAEDWRPTADVGVMKSAAPHEEIVVAKLLPLDPAEAILVLEGLGEADPETFLRRAEQYGAGAFTQSPLSLRLLSEAVKGNQTWPRTRLELFSSAVNRLAHEDNERHAKRPAPQRIEELAERTFLLQMLSGSASVWKPQSTPPGLGSQPPQYLTAHDLGIEPSDRDFMLDTALFAGDGQSFQPAHRTVQEFIAGRALSKAVLGSDSKAALPFGRACALIMGNNSAAPTELRGLMAWFAAHLAVAGRDDLAERLAELDPITVAVYGDASGFSVQTRRAILANLPKVDPYFLSSSAGVTSLGGIVGEDLRDEVRDILARPPEENHLLLAVLSALEVGHPLESLRAELKSFALNETYRASWRWAATRAYLNGTPDRTAALTQIYADAAKAKKTSGNAEFRLLMAPDLVGHGFSTDDLKALIGDYAASNTPGVIGRLFGLQRKLELHLPAGLFEAPVIAWIPKNQHGTFSSEIESLLDDLLARKIASSPAATGADLWRWSRNSRPDFLRRAGTRARETIDTRLSTDRKIERDFIVAMHEDPQAQTSAGHALGGFQYACGRYPSSAAIQAVLEHVVELTTLEADAKRLLNFAIVCVRQQDADFDTFWRVFEVTVQSPWPSELLKQLDRCCVDDAHASQAKWQAEQLLKQEEERLANVTLLLPIIDGLCDGSDIGNLRIGAEDFLGSKESGDLALDDVTKRTNVELAEAHDLGWRAVASAGAEELSPEELGKLQAQGHLKCRETVVLAGVERLLDSEHPPALAGIPIEFALVVLRTLWHVSSVKRRTRLQTWALARLDGDPAEGAAYVRRFWESSIDNQAANLDDVMKLSSFGIEGGALSIAIDAIFTSRPSMPPAMRQHLGEVAVKLLPRNRVKELALLNLGSAAGTGQDRGLWESIALLLDFDTYSKAMWDRYTALPPTLNQLLEFGEYLISSTSTAPLRDSHPESKVRRLGFIVQLFGRYCTGAEKLGVSNYGLDSRLNSFTRAAFQALASMTSPEATAQLEQCVGDPALSSWAAQIQHELAQQRRLRLDSEFRHPDAQTVLKAVEGGPPVNGADLRAIVVEELEWLRRNLRTSDTSPWRQYWNTDSFGKVINPRNENRCRDHLLEQLKGRVRPYKIVGTPEAQKAEETRVDILVMTGAGRDLPVELKRHYHAEVWTAASTQLVGYTKSATSDGFGVYVVFWFGRDVEPLPARPGGGPLPSSAEAFEAMLRADLPAELKGLIDIVVLDVSAPQSTRSTTTVMTKIEPSPQPSAATKGPRRSRAKTPPGS